MLIGLVIGAAFMFATAAAVPAAPTIGTPVALSSTSIRWYFTDTASDEAGFKVHDSADAIVVQEATPDLTFLDETGLFANTRYTRHVHSYNSDGDSIGSADATLYTLPNAPASPSATAASTSQMDISWEAGLGGADHYHVRSSSDGYASIVYDNVLTSFTENLLASNTRYTYRIYAVNADGAESATYTEVNGYTMIETPTGVSFGTATASTIDVSAAGTLTNLSAGTSGVVLSNTTKGTDSGWTQANVWTSGTLDPNSAYDFTSQARNGDGTATAIAGPGVKYTLASTPVSPEATAISTSQIDVSWSPGAGGADHYHVRSSDDDYATIVYDNVLTSFSDTLLTPNTQYTYRIYSVNPEGFESDGYTEISRYTMVEAPQGVAFGAVTDEGIFVSARGAMSNPTAGLTGILLTNTTASTDSGWIQNNSWTSQPLSPDTLYNFKVQARNGDGVVTSETGLFAKYTLAEVPAAAEATAASISQIDVSWTASVGGADHYHVRSSSDNFMTNKYSGNSLSYSETSLLSNTRYTYRIFAINADGVSRPDYAEVSRYTSIQTPSGVSFGTITPYSITASAGNPLSNLTEGFSGVFLTNTTEGTNSGWTKTNSWASESLIPDTVYNFKAQARNGDGITTAETALTAKSTLDGPYGSPGTIVTSPIASQEVAGPMPIVGTASAGSPPFDHYVIEYGKGADPTRWIKYGDSHTDMVWNGTLETINTLRLTNEIYSFRLTVFDKEGGKSSAAVVVQVNNSSRPGRPHGNYQLDTDVCALCHANHIGIFAPGILRFAAADFQSQLCYTCHNGTSSVFNIEAEFDSSVSHHPIADAAHAGEAGHAQNCSDCHDPHGSDEIAGQAYPSLLLSKDKNGVKAYQGNVFCYSCHGENGQIVDRRYFESNNAHNNTDSHQITEFPDPASGTKIKCSICHKPHGSPQFKLRVNSDNVMCEAAGCHPEPNPYLIKTDNEVVTGVGYPDTRFGQPFYAGVRVFAQDAFVATGTTLKGPKEYRSASLGFPPRLRGIAIGDATNDGRDDIVASIADGSSNTLAIWARSNDGYSLKPVRTFSNRGGYGVAVGDVNLDGSNETVVTMMGTPSEINVINILGDAVIGSTPYETGGTDSRKVAIGDITGDGVNDVVVTNYGSNDITVFKQSAGLLEKVGPVSSGGQYPSGIAIGDVDNDQENEVIVANQGYEGQATVDQSPYNNDKVTVFDSDNNGNLTQIAELDNGSATAAWDVAVGDVVGDSPGNEIVAVGHALWPGGLTNNGRTTVFNLNDNSVRSYDTGSADSKGVAVADVNNDGKADVSVLGSNTLTVFPYGAADLSEPVAYPMAGMNTVGLADEPGPIGVGDVVKAQPYGHRIEVMGTCTDCHDPHSVTKEAPNWGASGVEPVYGPTTTFDPVLHVVKDYQLCLKCHSSASVPLVGQRDVAEEMNPTNLSYHSVMAAGKRTDMPPNSFVDFWTQDSRLLCGDCHGKDAMAPAQMRHGSANAYFLRKPYAGLAPSDSYLLCYSCHNEAFYGPGGETRTGNKSWKRADSGNNHAIHSNLGVNCDTCHDVHGSETTTGIIRSEMQMTGAAPGPFECSVACH